MTKRKPHGPAKPDPRPVPIQKESYQPATGPANPRPPQGGSGTEPPSPKESTK